MYDGLSLKRHPIVPGLTLNLSLQRAATDLDLIYHKPRAPLGPFAVALDTTTQSQPLGLGTLSSPPPATGQAAKPPPFMIRCHHVRLGVCPCGIGDQLAALLLQ